MDAPMRRAHCHSQPRIQPPIKTGLLELTLADPADPTATGPPDKKKAAKPGKPSLYHFK